MKLGTDTNSLTNYMLSGTKGQPEPKVGMGATLLSWTDRYPATIVEVLDGGKMIGVQEDEAIRTDSNGMSESQQYKFYPCPEQTVQYFKKDKKGAYREVRKNENGRYVFVAARFESVNVTSITIFLSRVPRSAQ